MSDDDLTAAAAAGDSRALGAIFERHHEALYRYCVALLDHPEQAAEAVQTTMFAAREGLSEGMPPTALRPWLHAIAHAAALAMLKARGESAPPRERSALLLHEMNGLDYAEVASVLGIARTAARRAVLDAHKALPAGHGDTGRELREVYALPEGVAAAVLGAGQASIGTHDEEDRPRHRVLLSFLVLAVVAGSTVALAALGTFDSGGGGGGHRSGGPAATPIQVAPGPGQAKPRHKGHKGHKGRKQGGAAGGAGGATPGSGAPGGLTPGAPSSAVSAYTTPGERIESAVGAP